MSVGTAISGGLQAFGTFQDEDQKKKMAKYERDQIDTQMQNSTNMFNIKKEQKIQEQKANTATTRVSMSGSGIDWQSDSFLDVQRDTDVKNAYDVLVDQYQQDITMSGYKDNYNMKDYEKDKATYDRFAKPIQEFGTSLISSAGGTKGSQMNTPIQEVNIFNTSEGFALNPSVNPFSRGNNPSLFGGSK